MVLQFLVIAKNRFNYEFSKKELDLTHRLYMNKKQHQYLNENCVIRSSIELFYSPPCLIFLEACYIDTP